MDHQQNYERALCKDYEQIFVPNDACPETLNGNLNAKFTYGDANCKFLYALDDIQSVLDGTSNSSTLNGPIQWLTINPGTQTIGSFNPVDTNFYKDAYEMNDTTKQQLTNAIIELKSAPIKKRRLERTKHKIFWSYEKSDRNNINDKKSGLFGRELTIQLEEAYRASNKNYMFDFV
ncbi:hypothetical protein AKO1_001386, partial [Acrasis kona]